MSEHAHPGIHPDADSLSAFAENALPEHERAACLTHLAECARCREIVYLTQAAVADEGAAERHAPVPVEAVPIRFWKRWFAPVPVLAAAAVAGILVVSIGLYRLNKSAAPATELTASAPAEVSATPAAPEQPLTSDSAPATVAPRAKIHVQREPIQELRPPAAVDAAPLVAAPPPEAVAARGSPAPPTVVGAGPQGFVETQSGAVQKSLPTGTLAGVEGRVSDPAGGVIPNAQVDVVDGATGKVVTSTTDRAGQFSVAGLTPGRYQLKITSPGFRQTSKQIELQPQLMARADSVLEIGSANESVTVTAEASALSTETSSLGVTKAKRARAAVSRVSALPSKLPSVSAAAKDKLMVAADANGALFFSRNAGKSWKAIKPQWTGKVVRIEAPPDIPGGSNALFRIDTDGGAVWLSKDGDHWYASPGPR